MRVLVSTAAHFAITGDGALWTSYASMSYSFWARYLDVFEEAKLLVRAHPRSAPPEGWKCATGPGVKAAPLPDSTGLRGYLRDFSRITRVIRAVLSDAEAVQLRVPCHIGGHVWRHLSKDRPYGVEVIADPYDVFSPGSVRHPLRPLFRWWLPAQLRTLCAGACATAYVTRHALQDRYPPAPTAFSTNFSDIELPRTAFVPRPRSAAPRDYRMTLVLVGSLAQLYKGVDVLLDALAACSREGLNLRLKIIGDGKHRSELEARSRRLGLAEHVCFLGQLTSSDFVRQQLDQADLFVLPSRTEGLSKAMIEAMARGLPCLGSTVGGFPELLAPEDLVPPGDAPALAAKIREVVSSPERMASMSSRNLTRASEYGDDVLRPRRISFYQRLRADTTRWFRTRGVPPRH
jgi:glycosyltransferase involved in cell wall biosynthesis